MKKILLVTMLLLAGGCASKQEVQETYPYGLTQKEWNELSIKDKTKMRRDFYFYEKGHVNFVNPTLEIEGKKEEPSSWHNSKD